MPDKNKNDASSRDSSESRSSDSSNETKDNTPASDIVLTKYSMAAEIVNTVLKQLISETKDGVEVGHLCSLGDAKILELTDKLYRKEKKIQKGIAMPTCVSVDNCICHFSPLKSELPVLVKEGQLVKFELGAHVDGFIATAAHTIVVGASKEKKIEGKQANVIVAAYNAMETVLRMLKPSKGLKNTEITDSISKLAKLYDATPVENMLSHQMEQFKSVSEKQIIQNPSEEQKSKVEKCTFENHEVYAIDILISSGEGKAKAHDARTTIFKKSEDAVYNLKLKSSRAFYFESQQKFGVMPFSIRHFDDEIKAKIGSNECVKHNLLQPYEVVFEKEGEFVAQFKSTAIIMPNGILKITGLPLDYESINCDVKLSDEFNSLLKEALKPKPKKKKPVKKSAADAPERPKVDENKEEEAQEQMEKN